MAVAEKEIAQTNDNKTFIDQPKWACGWILNIQKMIYWKLLKNMSCFPPERFSNLLNLFF
jgi:hypothetical protein